MAVTHRSKSATIRSSNFNRFLKPGALARLRDSRISTTKVYNKPDVNSMVSGESNGVVELQQIDESFLFTVRTFGPRILQRKKLGARKSAYVAAPAASEVAADVVAH